MAKKNEKVKETERMVCLSCGKDKRLRDYYNSSSYLYRHIGKMPFCKDCLDDVWTNISNTTKDDKKKIYQFCSVVDLPFHMIALEGALTRVENSESESLHRQYVTFVNSLKKAQNFADDFISGEHIDEFLGENRIISEEIKIPPETIDFWGVGYRDEDYIYLNDMYNKYTNTYTTDTPVMEELLKQASYESLIIRNDRLKNKDVSKNLKNLQEILGSANIKPAQETGANAADQNTFGTFIKKIEDEEPIPDPLKIWTDANTMLKLVRIFFTGHLAKMLGKENELSQEYDAEMAKYTVGLKDGDSSLDDIDIEKEVDL